MSRIRTETHNQKDFQDVDCKMKLLLDLLKAVVALDDDKVDLWVAFRKTQQ